MIFFFANVLGYVDKQSAVKMIRFVLNTASQKTFRLKFLDFPVTRQILQDDFFREKIKINLPGLRRTVALAVQNGISVPALTNAVEYIDALSGSLLGANLIQAQRDYFGSHTFRRIDRDGVFCHDWKEHYKK